MACMSSGLGFTKRSGSWSLSKSNLSVSVLPMDKKNKNVPLESTENRTNANCGQDLNHTHITSSDCELKLLFHSYYTEPKELALMGLSLPPHTCHSAPIPHFSPFDAHGAALKIGSRTWSSLKYKHKHKQNF